LHEQGIEATTTPGGSGQFDVRRDGDLVYSKHEEHRFPVPGEVLSLLRQ
jgi:predicted Rdx family selenoprotein